MDFTLKTVDIVTPSTRFYQLTRSQLQKYRWPIYGGILILISSLIAHNLKTESDAQSPVEQLVDTYIPQGYVLIPIEIQNSKNLDSIIGNKAVIDLYGKGSTEKKTRRIGTALRLLRSPYKASEVSILVPETEVSRILGEDRLYWVAIHNPKKLGTKIDKAPLKKRIIYMDSTKGAI